MQGSTMSVTNTRPTEVANREVLRARQLDFEQIPVIDLGAMFDDDREAIVRTALAVRDACVQVGFFYIKNHRVPMDTVLDASQHTRDFFLLPLETKLQYDIGRIKRHRGYVPFGALTADPDAVHDVQEGYEVGLELPGDDPEYLAGSALHGPNVWPDEVSGFGPSVYRYFENIIDLGHVLFRAFAIALDLPDDHFEPMITRPTAQLRLIYYPESEVSSTDVDTLGIGAHTDYECFTILWQDQSGLQVQNRAKEWVEAPPIDGTFVVNIGDMMQRWTNDLFVSTPHRVVNPPGKERISFPLFFGANHDTVVRCLDNCTSADNPPRYPPTHSGYWIENMHTFSYVYRHHERGKLPNPELSDVS